MLHMITRFKAGLDAMLRAAGLTVETKIAPTFRYQIECRDPFGVLRWSEDITNLVTTAGKNDLLDKYFAGSAYTAAWFVGLIDNSGFSTLAAGDTMASHAGWTELAAYVAGTRPAATFAAASAGSKDNSASPASFALNANNTVNGAFVASNSTKSGTTGILYSEASFGSARALLSGDTLAVTVTMSA